MGQSSSLPQPIATVSQPFQPTTADVVSVKESFREVSKPLPLELIDQILDEASYWPHSSITLVWPESVPYEKKKPSGTGGLFFEDKMYMRTLPFAVYGTEGDMTLTKEDLVESATESFSIGMENGEEAKLGKWLPPRGEHPCRKIVFQLWSKDQGWSDDGDNHGTYRGSYSWFDASVETVAPDILNRGPIAWPRFLLRYESDTPLVAESHFNFIRRDPDHPFLPPPTHLQRNIHASRDFHHHTVTWHYLDFIDENSPPVLEADLNGQGWKSLDGTFVRSLKVGDCITLWMRTRFPGWWLRIEKAKIEVYWAV